MREKAEKAARSRTLLPWLLYGLSLEPFFRRFVMSAADRRIEEDFLAAASGFLAPCPVVGGGDAAPVAFKCERCDGSQHHKTTGAREVDLQHLIPDRCDRNGDAVGIDAVSDVRVHMAVPVQPGYGSGRRKAVREQGQQTSERLRRHDDIVFDVPEHVAVRDRLEAVVGFLQKE